MTISSPFARSRPKITLDIPSVVLRVRAISSGEAFTRLASRARRASFFFDPNTSPACASGQEFQLRSLLRKDSCADAGVGLNARLLNHLCPGSGLKALRYVDQKTSSRAAASGEDAVNFCAACMARASLIPEATTMLPATRPLVDKNSRLLFMTCLLEEFFCEADVHRFDQRRPDKNGRGFDSSNGLRSGKNFQRQ